MPLTPLVILMLILGIWSPPAQAALDWNFSVHALERRADWSAGPRLLVVAGIHGDESGGYLAAEHLLHGSIAQGSLDVIPRLNARAIILRRRGINADMNRLFDRQTAGSLPESGTVEQLKTLLREYDYILTLHDGSGFYSPEYIDDRRNPLRYGQSHIIDAERARAANRDEFCLSCFAERVVERVNQRIANPEHHFRVNNHNTAARNSLHAEQRKSLTFYALSDLGIPAFCSEASKDLPNLASKVHSHIALIQSFADELGLGLELPEPSVGSIAARLEERQRLDSVQISVNGVPRKVHPSARIFVAPGDRVRIDRIQAGSDVGWFPDLYGTGNYADFGDELAIHEDTKIVVRRDHQPRASIEVIVVPNPADTFDMLVDGQPRTLRQGEFVDFRADLQLLRVQYRDGSEGRFNFSGYVPPDMPSGDPDDRGYLIEPQHLDWQYSVERRGMLYRAQGLAPGSVDSQGEVYIRVPERYGK